jgi:CRP-like cAMP-binding protein
VESGAYDVSVRDKHDKKAKPQKVATRSAGQNFGELALMYNAPRAATITCTSAGHMWVLNRYAFRCIVQDIGAGKLREYVRFMDQVPLLSPLARFERQQLAEALEEVSFQANETIFKQGDEGDAMYIVGDGETTVYKVADGEQEAKQVNTCKVGDYFGERALLNNAPRAASVVAKTRVHCLKLDRNAFQLIFGPLEEMFQRKQTQYESNTENKEGGDDEGYDEADEGDLLDKTIKLDDLEHIGQLGTCVFCVWVNMDITCSVCTLPYTLSTTLSLSLSVTHTHAHSQVVEASAWSL